MTLNRQSELEAFKRLDLAVIASSYGYVVDKRRSTRSTVMMSSGTDKIAISKRGSHYIYWSVHDEESKAFHDWVTGYPQWANQPAASLAVTLW